MYNKRAFASYSVSHEYKIHGVHSSFNEIRKLTDYLKEYADEILALKGELTKQEDEVTKRVTIENTNKCKVYEIAR